VSDAVLPPKVLHLVRETAQDCEPDERLAVLGQETVQLRQQVADLQKELSGVRANAHNTKRRQMQFLVSVAHELRNPLVPLRMAALRMGAARHDDEAFSKLQATVKDQVAQMSRLVGDLLDGTRLGAGRFRLERTQLDICGVLQLAGETCQAEMDAREQVLACTLPAGPVIVLGDAARLVQVFCNLLQNSSKYSARGGQISLRAEVHGEALAVTVADNGIGISAATLPQVFDMFARDTHAASVNPGGLGIGLAVVHALVKAHEGTVAVHSAGEGLGCVMVVTLPVQPPRAPDPPQEPIP